MLTKNDQKSFYWGISTASYHVEGGNYDSDWYDFEKDVFVDDPDLMAGEANDYWNRWHEDHELMSELGTNSYRTSVEWSRIHISPNEFDEKAIKHYKKIFKDLRSRNITIVLTLFHFSSPKWFAEKGGFEKRSNLKYFKRFAEKVLDEFGEYVEIVTPVSETLTYVSLSYTLGYWLSRKKSIRSSIKVTRNLLRAHFITAHLIEKKQLNLKICSSEHFRFFEYPGSSFFINTFEWIQNALFNYVITNSLVKNRFIFPFGFGGKISKVRFRPLDYLGVQFYGKVFLKFYREGLRVKIDNSFTDNAWKTDYPIGEVDPRHLYRTIKRFSKYNLPMLITESGISTKDDKERIKYIEKHLGYLSKAINRGFDVRGFFYFTLGDCFEWSESYTQKFGLVEVNRKNNLKRTPKPSFYYYKEKIETFSN